jgi:hypothetical protein
LQKNSRTSFNGTAIFILINDYCKLKVAFFASEELVPIKT